MKIRPVGAELFHADGQTDGHDEVSSGFSQILRRSPKMYSVFKPRQCNVHPEQEIA